MATRKTNTRSAVAERSAVTLRPARRSSKDTRRLMALVDDGRSSRAVMLRQLKAELIASIPSSCVTSVAHALAERCAVVGLRLAEMDKAALENPSAATKDYIALSGHHQRLLRQLAALGRVKTETSSPLAEMLAQANRREAMT